MIKIGLKLWSTNFELFSPAVSLYRGGEIDFVELYVVPSSFHKDTLGILRSVPITLHAPHEKHGLDLGKKSDTNEQLIGEAIFFAEYFRSSKIVVHPGYSHKDSVLSYNIKSLLDSRFLLENMPVIADEALGGGKLLGATLGHIREMTSLGNKLCLDFGHAVKSAVSQGWDYKRFISGMISDFTPEYFHISDGALDNPYDEHLDLGRGGVDLSWVKGQLDALGALSKRDLWVVFETPKAQGGLENDVKNIRYFRGIV